MPNEEANQAPADNGEVSVCPRCQTHIKLRSDGTPYCPCTYKEMLRGRGVRYDQQTRFEVQSVVTSTEDGEEEEEVEEEEGTKTTEEHQITLKGPQLSSNNIATQEDADSLAWDEFGNSASRTQEDEGEHTTGNPHAKVNKRQEPPIQPTLTDPNVPIDGDTLLRKSMLHSTANGMASGSVPQRRDQSGNRPTSPMPPRTEEGDEHLLNIMESQHRLTSSLVDHFVMHGKRQEQVSNELVNQGRRQEQLSNKLIAAVGAMEKKTIRATEEDDYQWNIETYGGGGYRESHKWMEDPEGYTPAGNYMEKDPPTPSQETKSTSEQKTDRQTYFVPRNTTLPTQEGDTRHRNSPMEQFR